MYTITLRHRTTGNETFYKSGISETDLIKECDKAENLDSNWAFRAVVNSDNDYFNNNVENDYFDEMDVQDGEDNYYNYL